MFSVDKYLDVIEIDENKNPLIYAWDSWFIPYSEYIDGSVGNWLNELSNGKFSEIRDKILNFKDDLLSAYGFNVEPIKENILNNRLEKYYLNNTDELAKQGIIK